jgi:predicted esterase
MPTLRKIATATFLAGLTAVICTIPADAIETRGSGGAYSDRTNQSFTARNGLSSKYHIYAANVPQDHAAGLVLQFHGDGAYEFQNPSSSYSLGGSSGIVSQSRQRGYITVAALAPDRSGSITWWENGSANADYVADLVASLKSSYNIDTEDVWLVGYSGGAQFITQFYLPKHSNQIDGGGSVVFGGGGSPRVTANTFDPALVRDFPMHWYTGANDTGSFDALGAARAGVNWYAGRGFETDLESPAGVGHNLSGRFGPVLAKHLDAHEPNSSGASSVPVAAPAPAPSTTPPATAAPTSAPTIVQPVAPTATQPAPSTAPAEWAHVVRPTRNGAHLDVDIPVGVRPTTFRVTTLDNEEYWYTYTTLTGKQTLTISNELQPDTEYRYTVEADGSVVASGTFRTLDESAESRGLSE